MSYDSETIIESLEELSRNMSYMSSFSNLFRWVALILSIIGMWNMFNKAGEPGWGALIPYYKVYLLYKIADMKKMFWLYLATAIGSTILIIILIFAFFASIIGAASANDLDAAIMGAMGTLTAFLIIFAAAMIIGLVLKIMNAIKLAQVFNLNGGYAVGIFFLPFVFYMILGLNKDIHYKNRIPAAAGFNGQNGYGQDPYANNYYSQNMNAQNPYQQNSYQQNTYAQNPYQQNSYQQNTYAQNPYQQNSYQQNTYAQNPYAQQPYSQTAEAQNSYDQYAAEKAQAQDTNPYANPSKDAVWNNIYDDNSNNLN